MNSNVVQGQYIVMAAMAVTIGVALLMMTLPIGGFAPVSVGLVLISLSLYDGQSWARWVLGVLLLLLGLLWGIQYVGLVRTTDFQGLMVIFLVLAFGALVSGPALLLSRQVREFMQHRKTVRNALVHRVLIVVWVLAVLAMVGSIVSRDLRSLLAE